MTALALCRFANFMAAMLIFGSSPFLSLYAPAGVQRSLSPTIRRLSLAASVIGPATALLWLALEAAAMEDDRNAAIARHDRGGLDQHFVRRGLDPPPGPGGARRHRIIAPRDGCTALAVLADLGLASFALVGYATLQPGPDVVLHRAKNALHLVSTGAWLGGLISFVLCLDAYEESDLKRNAVEAMTRFSFFDHFVVRRSWRRELSTSRLSRPARRCR